MIELAFVDTKYQMMVARLFNVGIPAPGNWYPDN
jgi:hypothetical protein